MAVCSLYEKTSFLNRCWKSPRYFPVDQFFSNARHLLGREICACLFVIARVIGYGTIVAFMQMETIIKGLNYFRKARQSMRQCAIGLAPHPLRIGVVVLWREKTSLGKM